MVKDTWIVGFKPLASDVQSFDNAIHWIMQFVSLTLIHYKNKGSKSYCVKYRGISLLSVAGKIFTRILPNRLITASERSLPEAQCGFRPRCSTVDTIFVLRPVQQKCIEQNKAPYPVLIDL